MAEAIIDGIGSGYAVQVDDTNRMMVTGSITSMPSISVGSLSVSAGSESYIKGGSILTMGTSGGTSYPLLTDTDGILQTSATVTTGSEMWIQNPVGISGINVIGSVIIKSAPLIGISGAIFDSGDITGSMVISSSTRLGVSGGIFTGGDLTGSFAPKGIGSVVIKSAPLIGVSGLVFTQGNIVGSFAPKGIGSVIIKSSNLIGVSGAIFDSGDITGSVVVSSAARLGISGAVDINNPSTIGSIPIQTVSGNVAIIGSIVIGSVSASVESVYVQSGDNLAITSLPGDLGSVVVSSSTLLGVSGLIFTDGNLTGSMAMKGVGSMVIASSVNVGISGPVWVQDVDPDDTSQNNAVLALEYQISGTTAGTTGSAIGSIVQSIGAGSFVQVLTWSNDLLTNIGSWS